MTPTLDAVWRSWVFDPWLLAGIVLTASIYYRGWRFLHRRDPARWKLNALFSFGGGLLAIVLALCSPIEPFSGLLLQVHMIQHVLLMMVAPPLLWLGSPLFPMLRGLPEPIRSYWVGPLLASHKIRHFFGWLTQPLVALPLFVAVNTLWHLPVMYDLAMRSTGWHYLQHLSFLGVSLLFWYPVVRPYPSKPHWSAWLLLPYLFLADLFNTALSGLLAFSSRVLYPYYDEVPRLGGLTALDDQSTAGLMMWVPGSVAFLFPLFFIGTRLLFGAATRHAPYRKVKSQPIAGGSAGASPSQFPAKASNRIALPLLVDHPAGTSSFDLLQVPLIGSFLKWRYARLCLQLPLLLLAVALIYDGFTGPQISPMNLAGVLPWIHWRGILILGLLIAGNLFCMGCPFVLPRMLARRWLPLGWNWPRALRSKWLAVVLVMIFLWAYEAFSLWDRPWATACLALAYFVGALVIDSLFRGGSFCKYVCPIGQFNFVHSLVSPLGINARDPEICASCQTKDCIRGRDGIPGCELHLFVPRKAGNMDCTMCLDCVHTCPHDNIEITASMPGAELVSDQQRSGIGRFSQRPDIAALILVLVFGAFANAAGMVAPVLETEEWLSEQCGITSPLLIVSLYYLTALIVLPLGTVVLAAWLSRRDRTTPLVPLATRFVYALVPLGLGMWLAHYSFHLFTSYETIVPVTQRFVAELGYRWLGKPEWSCSCCGPVPGWLLPLEILFLDIGLLLSLYTGYRLSLSYAPRPMVALRMLIPWALLMFCLFVLGLWILFQPMQMRGTM